MNCPKCLEPMAKIFYAGVEVDRCTLCKGIFFDDLEKERLQEIKGAEVIDIGHPSVGERFNRPNRINCPRCGSRMFRTADAGQPHIWFEHCATCGGSFLDAGEFHDLKHHNIVDLFRDMAIRKKLRSHPDVVQERRKA